MIRTPGRLRLPDHVGTRSRRQMHDVHPAAGRRGGVGHPADGVRLGGRRTRRNERRVVPAVRRGCCGQHRGILSVHGEQSTQIGHLRGGSGQLGPAQRRELRNAGVLQEALHPEHPGGEQAGQVSEIAGDGATPESDVDPALFLCRTPLHSQRLGGQGRRQRVEGHVEQRRHPAGSGRGGGGDKSLPVRTAGLVDVHVGVHQTGDQYHICSQQHLVATGKRTDSGNLSDPAVRHPDRGWALGAGDHRPLRADHHVVHARSPAQ